MLYGDIGNLIAAIGQPHFATRVHQLLGRMAVFDWMTLMVVRDGGQPCVGYCSIDGPVREVILGPYLDGRYAEDPFLIGIRGSALAGLWELHDLAVTQGGIEPDYSRLLASVDVSDEVCFISSQLEIGRAIVSMVRTRSNDAFSPSERSSLRGIEPIVLSALDNHFDRSDGIAQTYGHLTDSSDRSTILRQGLARLANGHLTHRERDVGQLILCGYSTNAIATILDISPGTVKIHRKNIYHKLSISSQGELFAAFFWSLLDEDSAGAHLPL